MLELPIFFIIYILFFCSTIGYGLIFFNITSIKLSSDSIAIYSLFGLIFLTFISYFTILFLPHDIYFNFTLHLIGIFSFYKKKKLFNYSNITLLIILIIFIGLIISKNHDDFPFYHLQQSLNFSQNKIQLGMWNLGFSYAHHSSLLYLNSLFYIPIYKFYFFNVPNIIFFTSIVLLFINNSFNKKDDNFLRFYSLFATVYFLIKFSRLSEFGTDVVGQCLIILFLYYICKILFFEKNNKNLILFSGLILCYCLTLKTYFVLYFLFYLYLIFKINLGHFFVIIKKNYIFFFFSIILVFLFLLMNLLTSGCLIYPLPFLCFEGLSWAMPIEEVREYKLWYEVWAKAVAGAGYVTEDYFLMIKNFKWVKFWFHEYFIGKMTDNLLIFVLLILIFIFTFGTKTKKKQTLNKYDIYGLIFFTTTILIFWFLKHPQIRYGGYPIFFLLFCLPISIFLSLGKLDIKKLNRSFKFFIIISLSVFLTKNVIRINSEFNRSDMYKFTNFPFFSVPDDLIFKKKNVDDVVTTYMAIDNNCWYSPSPCPYSLGLRAKKKFGFIIFYNENNN
jgi:hypothetical protein